MYVYRFTDTDETIEVKQSFTDETLTEYPHPDTGNVVAVKKVFQPVGVTFKGDGFFKTDNRPDSKTDNRPDSSDSPSSEPSGSDDPAGSKATSTDGGTTDSGSTSKPSSSTSSATSSSED